MPPLETVTQWVELLAVGGGTFFTAAIALDRWVNGRVGSDRFSEAIGKINAKIISLEKDVLELKVIQRERERLHEQTPRPPSRY